MSASEQLFVKATLANGGGTTMREAKVMRVYGSALLGPTWFPRLEPRLHEGERLKWMKSGWVITTREKKP